MLLYLPDSAALSAGGDRRAAEGHSHPVSHRIPPPKTTTPHPRPPTSWPHRPPSSTRSSGRCSTWAARSPRPRFDELLKKIPRLIGRLIAFEAFAVYLLDERRGELKVGLLGRVSGERRSRFACGSGMDWSAPRSRAPAALVNDLASDPRYVEFVPGMASEIVVPLLHKSRPIGALNILSRNHDQFSRRDVAILRQFAAHVAVALVNARLFEQSRLDAEAFETLAEIGREVASVLDLDELFARIAQLAATDRLPHLRHPAAQRGRRARDQDRGAVRREARRAAHPPRRGLVGYAALHQEPVLVPDVSQDPRYIRVVPDVRSELAIPLLIKDRCIGVVDLESPELDAFTKRDVEILTCSPARQRWRSRTLACTRIARERGAARERGPLRAARPDGALPTEPPKRLKGVEVAAAFEPARELGGDFHDYLAPESNTLVVAVGDVSGKGVPAALYSAFAAELVRGRTFRRRYLPERSSPPACSRRSTRSCISASSRYTARSATRSSI